MKRTVKIAGWLCACLLFLFFSAGAFAQLEIKYKDDYSAGGLYNPKTKTWAAPPVYKQLTKAPYCGADHSFTVYEARKGKQALLLDAAGKPIPGAVFDSVAYSCAGKRFLVKTKGKYAVYELGKGINPEVGFFDAYQGDHYSSPHRFFWIIRKDNKYALLNMRAPRKPAWNLDLLRAYGYPMATGAYLLWAKQNGRYGIVDSAGMFVIGPEYDSLVLPEKPTYADWPLRHFAAKKNGKWGLVNTRGVITAPLHFDTIRTSAYISRSPDVFSPVLPACRDGKWGIIDTSGNCVLPCEYDRIINICGDKKIEAVRNGKKGITDFSGKRIYPFMYPNMEVISYNYANAASFSNYLFSRTTASDVYDTAGHWGLTDNTGKVLREANAKLIRLSRLYKDPVNPEMEYVDDARFMGWIWNEGGVKNKTVVRMDSVFVEDLALGHYEVARYYGYHFTGGKTGIVDRNGKAIVPVKYDELMIPCLREDDGRYSGIRYRKTGAPAQELDEECRIDTKYPLFGRLGGKWGMLGWSGQELTPIEFDSVSAEAVPLWRYDDSQDSLFAARNLMDMVFKVYRGGLFGYYAPSGTRLLEASWRFAGIGIAYFTDSLYINKGPGNDVISSGRLFKVVRQNYAVKKLEVQVPGMVYNPDWPMEPMEGMVFEPMCFTQGGTLNLQNINTYQLVLKEWADDILFKYSDGPYRPAGTSGWREVADQLRLISAKDSIRESKEPFDAQRDFPEELNGGSNDPHFFAQYGKLWFLFDIRNGKCLNETAGFDSVQVGPEQYTAWKNGKFEKFNYVHAGPFSMMLDLELNPFADEGGYSFVARNAEVKYVQVPFTERIVWMDPYTYEERDSLRKEVARLPLVKSGEFNMYDNERKPVFKNWPNEILFPAASWEERFSVTDSSSVVYKPEKIANQEHMRVSGEYMHSLALRYGSTWKLVTLADPRKVIDGLESVQFGEGHWKVKKGGKTFYYAIADLSQAEGK